jgi:hypothetical protein
MSMRLTRYHMYQETCYRQSDINRPHQLNEADEATCSKNPISYPRSRIV